jgi:hypothetical protein
LIHKHNFRGISVAIIFAKEISNLVRGVDCFENGDRVCIVVMCDRQTQNQVK